MDNAHRRNRIGFTATHGLENADKGPFFIWNNGKCNNALTINSWWHQNFILEYEEVIHNDRQHPSQGPENPRPSVQDSVPTERVCKGLEQCGATADC